MIDTKQLAALHAAATENNTVADEYRIAVDAALPELLAEVEELRSLRIDNMRTNQWSGSICHANDLLLESQERISERIKELLTEVEELRKDKERLDWLEGHGTEGPIWNDCNNGWYRCDLSATEYHHVTARAAIDAAKGEKQ